MTDLRLFDNGEFQLQVSPDGDSFTVRASGLARALGIRDAFNLIQSIPEDEKGYLLVSTPGDQHGWYLTEPGFYRAIGQRQAARIKNVDFRAQVERFQKWVYADVLPAIRRAGAYRAQESIPSHAESLRGWADTVEKLEASEAKVIELEPKAAQAEFHRAADGLLAVGDFANKLVAWAKREQGVRVKHVEVWDFLGDIGLLIRGKTLRHNHPTAFAAERDFVRPKVTEYENGDGDMRSNSSPRLTPAGEGWAWDRAVRRIVEHGSLRPTKSIERKAS